MPKMTKNRKGQTALKGGQKKKRRGWDRIGKDGGQENNGQGEGGVELQGECKKDFGKVVTETFSTAVLQQKFSTLVEKAKGI